MVLNDIVEIVNGYTNIYISGHVNPDGDCIGATIAMALCLKKKGINTKILLKGVSSKYDYLPIHEYITDSKPDKTDVLICLDCGDSNRLGEFEECCTNAKEVINIDHHISNTHFGNYNMVKADASSTCEMLYDMIADKSLIDTDIAKAIYTGIVYDTGVFKHSNTTEHTHRIAGELINFSIDFSEIIDKVFYYKSVEGLKAQCRAIDNLRLYNDEKIALSYLSLEDQEKLGTEKKHTENIVQTLNEIEGIECAIFIYQLGSNSCKVSFRSKGKVNVCEIAKIFNGGGHIKAAGCTIENDIEGITDLVLREVEMQL
jgi:phosphoesterase RecJ-like protein